MASLSPLEPIMSPSTASPISPASPDDATPKSSVPCVYEKKSEVEAIIQDPKSYKKFVKRTPCAQCGIKCMAKRFGTISGLVAVSMIDTFWCEKCGRLLCEKHRNQHTCERQDFLDAKRRAMTPEQIKAAVLEKEQQKLQADAEASAIKKVKDAEISNGYTERKAKRKVIASKATHIANFLQRASRSSASSGGDLSLNSRNQKELLDLYTRASRISLELWNEYESPSINDIKNDLWLEGVEVYNRGCEITGTVIVIDGERFNTSNPWDAQAERNE